MGVKASPIRQAPGGAAVKVQVESSPDGIGLRTYDRPHWQADEEAPCPETRTFLSGTRPFHQAPSHRARGAASGAFLPGLLAQSGLQARTAAAQSLALGGRVEGRTAALPNACQV